MVDDRDIIHGVVDLPRDSGGVGVGLGGAWGRRIAVVGPATISAAVLF
jgi:hypothetical protein